MAYGNFRSRREYYNEYTNIWNKEMQRYKESRAIFFKERGIKYQFVDMKEKGMSKGEFNSVAQANGGLENMINLGWQRQGFISFD